MFVGILLSKLNLIRFQFPEEAVQIEDGKESQHNGYPDRRHQRKATAQKAAATRRRNAAKRSHSAKKAAETRAQAELNTLQVVQAAGRACRAHPGRRRAHRA